MSSVGANIKAYRQARGLSQSALAKLVRVTQPVIAELESGRQVGSKKLPAIANALGIPLSMLDPEIGGQFTQSLAPVISVHVRGSAQAGIWTEFDELPDAPISTVPAVPGSWPVPEQFAYQVAGDSMTEARLYEGDYVICVPYWQARSSHQTGDLVVVERRRGGATERTVKQIEIEPSGSCRLWPRSKNPRFQTPVSCDGPEPDGTEIEIVGLVVGSYTPR